MLSRGRVTLQNLKRSSTLQSTILFQFLEFDVSTWISIYIMMDYIKGTNAGTLWMLGLLKPEEQDAIVNDMAAILTQLRAFHPPKEGVVASAQGRAILDYRIGSHLVGPLQSHASFHPFLRVGVPLGNTAMNFGDLQPITTAIAGR
ncbi:uncharacterized protein PADG_06760 [Paracoccidioides brasiliensis Pb18]|uniref:Uncharacterized protein n=1 Tax=Paracoccidioides brasiliensis (strain Pb18) TaxID=502780 RepID=C1GHM4_PARBD|nr:uncharacterized protein PADG_06760 [Paracoccidioides brasiliensis Pb18]EEH50681.2 hypothetical protein PADG_06760 [Paracoccidioides brasiliensis Pb18]ODH53266.1 hypothetical protein GX48_00462 [Paracoccidioides brasiliensis]